MYIYTQCKHKSYIRTIIKIMYNKYQLFIDNTIPKILISICKSIGLSKKQEHHLRNMRNQPSVAMMTNEDLYKVLHGLYAKLQTVVSLGDKEHYKNA